MFFSAAFKAKARAALRMHWQSALLIALIVNLPGLLVQGIAAFTNNDAMIRLEEILLQSSGSSAAMSTVPQAVRAMLSESGIISMIILSVLAWLITPVLAVGMAHWTLERLRGQELPVSAVFSRLGIFMKSIGLRLFIVLKVFLWTLPGCAVFLLSILPLLRAGSRRSTEELLSAANLSITFIYLGMIVMVVLGVMGYLYYALSEFILADEPEERVLSCIRRSRLLMKGRRSVLMSLYMSFLLWYLLILFATSFIAGIAGPVIALVVQMLGSLFLSVYVLASEGAFYEALRKAPLQEIPAEYPEDENPDPDGRDSET